jgi:Lrp/AsnC family transcriptional regulator, leucine-responsive regulatory protein
MTETLLTLDAKAWAWLMALQAERRPPLKRVALAAGPSVPARQSSPERSSAAVVAFW